MASQDTAAAASIERFFQFSLLGLTATGFLALVAADSLDKTSMALLSAGLVLRFVMISGLLRFDFSERQATIATLL